MNEVTNQLPSLIIKENICFQIEELQIEIISYLGKVTPDIDYFEVNIIEDEKPGLLRIGGTDGALNRELGLRNELGDYKLISPLLAHIIEDNISIQVSHSTIADNTETNILSELSETLILQDLREEYLTEEYYPEIEIISDTSQEKLLILTYSPQKNRTLKTWLESDNSLEQSLLITSQICQLFRYLYQKQWCIINIIPEFIEIGKPIEFFDLTSAYPVGKNLNNGLIGNYCAPELAYCKYPIQETMSSYTVAGLLYHIVHNQNLVNDPIVEIQIKPIPHLYQILKICLSPIPEDRFKLEQLLTILVNTRKEISIPNINWQVASLSTLGLSINRLKNEDSYGIKQEKSNNQETVILAAIADGMGGMSQGELASKLAIKTILETPIPLNNQTKEQYQEWLNSLFIQANETVSQEVKDGGTTLSVIFAISQQLMISHVGDSRIYLLRQGEIKQLSQDHSLVAILLASGQITEAEISTHPDRNVLTKSIGGKKRLSHDYVQDLRQTISELTMKLVDQDIILLCSDGVWDLVSQTELAENFSNESNLQTAVDATINQVLERGASDNATLLAIRCLVSYL